MTSKDFVAPVAAAEPILILIADDEEPIVELLATFVTDLGYSPLVAQNGQQALDLACERLPSVNADIFTLALQHFAQAVGASKQKHIVLVLDRAGWYKSLALTVPARTSSAHPASLFSRATAGSSPCPMNHWSTDIFMISMNLKKSKQSVVSSYRTLPI